MEGSINIVVVGEGVPTKTITLLMHEHKEQSAKDIDKTKRMKKLERLGIKQQNKRKR